jgi:Sec-independent protein translocase protein TatA
MGLFGKDIKKIISEVRHKASDYSNGLQKEIDETFVDLREDYEQNSEVVPEFEALINELKPKLDSQDAKKLEAFTSKLNKVSRSARNGVEAMRELSRNQKKVSIETQWLYEEYED